MREKSVQEKSWWPFGIMASFVALALFDLCIVSLALRYPSQEMEQRPYEAGLAYEKTVAGIQARQRDGISFALHLESDRARIQVSGLVKPGPQTMSLELLRPDNPRLDQSYRAITYDTLFDFNLNTLRSGLWLVRIWLTAGSKEYYFESREVV